MRRLGGLLLLGCQFSRNAWIEVPPKVYGPELHRLIEGRSWGMKKIQERERKDKVKTDQKVLVMSRVGGPGPQGKGRSWRINRWENSIVFLWAFSLPANHYQPLSFPITSFIPPCFSCNLPLQHFQLIWGSHEFTIVAFSILCYLRLICSQLTSLRFVPMRDSYLSTHAEHLPFFLSRSTRSSWSTFTKAHCLEFENWWLMNALRAKNKKWNRGKRLQSYSGKLFYVYWLQL